MSRSLLKLPSGYLPVAMSLAGLALVLGHYAVYGNLHEVDEGTPAHLFQLLMAGQVPIVAFFVIKWLPRETAEASKVLAFQAGAGIAAFSGVYFLT